MEKNKVLVEVDGVEELRDVDYPVRRGRDEFVYYPVLYANEHIYENDNKIIVFTSLVK